MDIGAAYTGLQFIRQTFETLLSGKIEAEVQTRVLDGLKRVGEAQDALFRLRDDLANLQEENAALRSELAARDEWEATKAAYKLEQAPGGAIVYASPGPPKHYACTSCFAKRMIQILQIRHASISAFDCPACKAEFKIQPAQSISPRLRRELE